MKIILTKNQIVKVAESTDFKTMVKIAIKMIKAAKKKYKKSMVIEICAPISSGGEGSVEKNLIKMNKVIDGLADLEYIVFDQMPYEKKIGEIKANREKDGKFAYDMSVLIEFYEVFFQKKLIDMLVFLPDWKTSIGACWEYFKAKSLGIQTRQIHDNWETLIEQGERNIKRLTYKI